MIKEISIRWSDKYPSVVVNGSHASFPTEKEFHIDNPDFVKNVMDSINLKISEWPRLENWRSLGLNYKGDPILQFSDKDRLRIEEAHPSY